MPWLEQTLSRQAPSSAGRMRVVATVAAAPPEASVALQRCLATLLALHLLPCSDAFTAWSAPSTLPRPTSSSPQVLPARAVFTTAVTTAAQSSPPLSPPPLQSAALANAAAASLTPQPLPLPPITSSATSISTAAAISSVALPTRPRVAPPRLQRRHRTLPLPEPPLLSAPAQLSPPVLLLCSR